MRLHAFNDKKEYQKLMFKRNKAKYVKYGTIILSVCLLVFAIMYFSFSKFSTTKKFNVINAKVGDFSSGDVKLAYYVNGESSNTIPSKDSNLYVYKIECTNDAIGKWDSSTWSINISNLSSSTSCKIYFNISYTFDYNGSEQIFTVPADGYYKLETWGASGGTYTSTYIGGYGGYSVGIILLNVNDTLYINIGGSTTSVSGGYNGGGIGINLQNRGYYGGGGATHIAKISGLLSSLSSSVSNIIIVSGSGGGSTVGDNNSSSGGSGGGYLGNSSASSTSNYANPSGGSQTSGGSNVNSNPGTFGKGGNGTSWSGGGGSGYYGGAGGFGTGGGGGSGYIGNSL